MPNTTHDTIARRLTEILTKLNSGEKLDPTSLAKEFNVHVRTVQRDLNDRLAYLPLHKVEGRYHMDPAYLGRLDFRDIGRFASLAGVNGMFPSLTTDFLREVFDERVQPAWLVKEPHYEDARRYGEVFEKLQGAITRTQLISLTLSMGSDRKTYDGVAPYRLLNIGGIWYLATTHHGRYKTFGLGKISSVVDSGIPFDREPAVEKTIAEQDGAWHSNATHVVVLEVDPLAASYFKRRQLVPHQVIEREEGGALTVRCTAGHPQQILPVVRYWIPHVRIVSPTSWQAELEASLGVYLSHSAIDGTRSPERPTAVNRV